MATYKQLSDKGDGTILGQSSTDLISFYGATPVAKRSGSAQATIVATVIANTTGFVFASTTAATKIKNQLIEIRATLVGLGLWTGS